MNLLDYDNLLTLLRNAITGESRALSSAPNWQVLTSQARVHGVEPLVYDAALRLPDEQRPDKALATQMKQICLYQMQQQTLWLPRIKAAVTALRKAGIEPVLLKGFGLPSRICAVGAMRIFGWVSTTTMQVAKPCARHFLRLFIMTRSTRS